MKRSAWLGLKLLACVGALGMYLMADSMKVSEQTDVDRVAIARKRAGGQVRSLCQKAGLRYPPREIFIRAFKAEKVLEVWGADKAGNPLKLIQRYPIAAMSGTLGPKRKQGDLQVPEGFYHIDRFNPKSRFWLSLGLNYPNASDRILSDKTKPGGDIFIHGNAVSIGCMAMTDEKIDEIYLLALGARDSGQSRIHVHVFPFRMTPGNVLRHGDTPFWRSLEPVYAAFEKSKRVPTVTVDGKGEYSLAKP